MSNNLKNIQKIAKVGEILSKVVFICSIVGLVLCIVGAVSLALGVEEIAKIGGVSIKGLIEKEAELSVGEMCVILLTASIGCAFEIPLAKKAENYFAYQVEAGTPFTEEGADKLKKLGILTIVLPIVAASVSAATYAAFSSAMHINRDINMDNGFSVLLGLIYIAVSIVFRYGAELEEKQC